MRRFEGGAWVALGGTAFTPGRGDYHALALDSHGVPYVSFRNGPLGSSMSVMRFVEATYTYCANGHSTHPSTPGIGFTGVPALTGPDDFHLNAWKITNNQPGLLTWSLTPDNLPFQGGTRCVGLPFMRAGHQVSGGSAAPAVDDTGTLTFHVSQAWLMAQGLPVGASVYTQFWFRDVQVAGQPPAGHTAGLTFRILP